MKNENQNNQNSTPVRLPVVTMNGKSYFVDSRLRQYRNVENPHDFIDFDQPDVVYSYTRAQAIEDGVLADISKLAQEAGLKFPVAVTTRVFELLNDTAQPGQSFEGRAWDLLMILLFEIKRSKSGEIIYFSPLFNANEHEDPKPYKLYAKCHPGDDLEPVITVMFTDED